MVFGAWGKAPAPKIIFVVFVLFVATSSIYFTLSAPRGCLRTLRVRLSPNLPFEALLLRRISPPRENFTLSTASHICVKSFLSSRRFNLPLRECARGRTRVEMSHVCCYKCSKLIAFSRATLRKTVSVISPFAHMSASNFGNSCGFSRSASGTQMSRPKKS